MSDSCIVKCLAIEVIILYSDLYFTVLWNNMNIKPDYKTFIKSAQ